jgi:hypothetical protein
MSTKKTLVRLVQDEIDTGATAVEEIHKAIADLPLKMLEEIELLKRPAKQARRVQDNTIRVIYDLIRDINRRVGTFVSALLADLTKNRSVRDEPHAAHSRA